MKMPGRIRLLVGLFAVVISTAHPGITADLTAAMRIQQGPWVLSPKTNTYSSVVTLTNMTAPRLNGALRLYVTLASLQEMVVNTDVETPDGKAYLLVPLPSAGLTQRQSVQSVVRITNTTGSPVATTFSVATSDPTLSPTQILAEVADSLAAGNIDKALTRFSLSAIDRTVLANLTPIQRTEVIESLRSPRLVRQEKNVAVYALRATDTDGTPIEDELTMARQGDEDWFIVAW